MSAEIERLAAEVAFLVEDWQTEHPYATDEDLHAVEGTLISQVIPRDDPVALLRIVTEDTSLLYEVVPSRHTRPIDIITEAIQQRVDRYYNAQPYKRGNHP